MLTHALLCISIEDIIYLQEKMGRNCIVLFSQHLLQTNQGKKGTALLTELIYFPIKVQPNNMAPALVNKNISAVKLAIYYA